MKRLCLCPLLALAVALLIVGCGPSPEQAATMTAAAWTPTPMPTATPSPPTATPTPTPVPIDLTMTVIDEQGKPIAGASIVFPQSGSEDPVTTDAAGQYGWTDLAGTEGALAVSAQGYLDGEQSLSLQRGPNEVAVTLQRDPYGILPAQACAPGETLLFLEDIQDGQSEMIHNEGGVGGPAPLGPAVDEAGNSVLIHDMSTVAPGTEYETYLPMIAASGEPYAFGDAVWRMRFMVTVQTDWGLGWNTAGPSELGGTTLSGSAYGINFGETARLRVSRNIWDASGQGVSLGKPSLGEVVFLQKPGQWHYVEISTFQGHVQIWVDGKSVLDAQDDMPLPPGSFRVGGGKSGVLYYDAISVCGLSAPFTSMSSPVPAQ